MIEPMLTVRRVVREQYVLLHKRMMVLAREDEPCRLLMSAPGVGPFVALTYRAAVDGPARFRQSRAVGAHFGLAPRTHQSRELDRRGHITLGMAEMMVGGEEDLGHGSLTQERRLGKRHGTPGSVGWVQGHAFHGGETPHGGSVIAWAMGVGKPRPLMIHRYIASGASEPGSLGPRVWQMPRTDPRKRIPARQCSDMLALLSKRTRKPTSSLNRSRRRRYQKRTTLR